MTPRVAMKFTAQRGSDQSTPGLFWPGGLYPYDLVWRAESRWWWRSPAKQIAAVLKTYLAGGVCGAAE
jgi:hypothetical protein